MFSLYIYIYIYIYIERERERERDQLSVKDKLTIDAWPSCRLEAENVTPITVQISSVDNIYSRVIINPFAGRAIFFLPTIHKQRDIL